MIKDDILDLTEVLALLVIHFGTDQFRSTQGAGWLLLIPVKHSAHGRIFAGISMRLLICRLSECYTSDRKLYASVALIKRVMSNSFHLVPPSIGVGPAKERNAEEWQQLSCEVDARPAY